MRNNTQIQDWIEQSLASDPPRAKSLVMTVFGDAIAPHGGAIWLGSLISLMSHFAINDRLVRTSVFRLTEEGWLEAKRDGRRSSYQLASASYARFQHAYQRVYTPQSTAWDQSWILVIASNNESNATERGNLKRELFWEGFRLISPGVYAHPQPDIAALQSILERTNLLDQLLVCKTQDLTQVSNRPLSSLIASQWQLDEINHSYRQFIQHFSALPELMVKQELSAQAAFTIRSLLIHNFRRTQLHDPHLPVELRPAGWLGDVAYQLCKTVYQSCFQQAEELLAQALAEGPPSALVNNPDLHERFAAVNQSVQKT
ncbi:phenylacetic acid degradation operon negative regulatory protein PaaX [Undibacterium sp. TJN19]|uniref:phenylacetic acid degradation operon negative regulatory protein PaaX n=1 Tax=Undibacterium sp. TJN19 TaxID=3413055 RepID=UPI003BF31F68